ncbi:MAG: hemolysin family protein [Treponema sp.]|jgi:putative hemolysin|nr:hemolysin family protein [Treponema sp.]
MEDPLPSFLFILLIILKILCTLLESVLFSTRKTALRSRIESVSDTRQRKALSAALKLLESPERFPLRNVGTFLGILAGVVTGIGVVMVAAPTVVSHNVLVIMLVSLGVSLITLILGEILPRLLARNMPEQFIITLLTLFGLPLILIAHSLSRTKAGRAEGNMTADEFHIALVEGERSGVVESKERTMVEGVLYLGDREAGTFMTHRSEIEWLDINADAETARNLVLNVKAQRSFPVANGTLDEICGVVSVEDILRALLHGVWPGLRSIMKKPYFIPETISALKTFEAFRQETLLMVMDEYSGFVGILSIQDLMAELVGEFSTEAKDQAEILQQDDGSLLVEGGANIDEVADVLCLETLVGEHQEYHTLAGFILNLAGKIPHVGETFSHNGYQFMILSMDGNRIDKVLISSHEPLADSATTIRPSQ